tara:strand:- start:19 stop:1047 length:1029 start_codon:yes stop_codon:yes gene_type:complete
MSLQSNQNKIFKELNNLVKKFPFIVIWICHEYYRNIEVIEPHLGFKQKNPIKRILRIQKKIFALIKIFKSSSNYKLNYNQNDFFGSNFAFARRNENIYLRNNSSFNKKKFLSKVQKFLTKRFKSLGLNKTYFKGKKVLDCGCGAGRFTYILSKFNPSKIFGVDISKENIKIAKKVFMNKNTFYKVGNNLKIPFKSEQFDFVYSSGVVHHTKNMKKAIKELFRVCKKGGLIYLYVYGKGGIYWDARQKMNKLMKKIPQNYTQKFLDITFMPRERLMFLDNWYVSHEIYSHNIQLKKFLSSLKPKFIKKMSQGAPHDFSTGLSKYKNNGKIIWGDGELRYLIKK